MSKRSLFWGQASGKLGEAVYYRAGGEQRTRTWVPKIKNPRSVGQATQRCLFMNMVASFRAMKKFIQTGYINRKSNQSQFNAYVKDNFKANDWVAAAYHVQAAEFNGFGYKLANGTLPYDMSLKFKDSLDNPLGDMALGSCGLVLSSPIAEAKTDVTEKMSVYKGSTIYAALTSGGNPYNYPAEFTLIVAMVMQGSEGQIAYTLAVNCSAESTDELRLVQIPPESAPLSVDEIHNLLVVVGGTKKADATDTVENAEGIAITNNVASSQSMAGSIMIKAKTANGYDVTPAALYWSPDYKTTVDPFRVNGDYGKTIIAEYTGTSNMIE